MKHYANNQIQNNQRSPIINNLQENLVRQCIPKMVLDKFFMKHSSLPNLIKKLKSSPRIKGIFTIGATATKMNPSSDIDVAIILDKNSERIKSIYTIVENRFADIFFFDIDFLNQLKNKREVSANNFDGMFIEWLTNGKIEYDPENILSAFKVKINKKLPLQKVYDSEKRDYWIKTNYNFIANSRYYNSTDKLYHQALEFRLLYSVIELVSAYFSFRGIPWRGEKTIVKYFKQNDPTFFSIFLEYSKSSNLKKKMKNYQKMFKKIFFGEYQKWPDDFVVAISNQNQYDLNIIPFWDKLIR